MSRSFDGTNYVFIQTVTSAGGLTFGGLFSELKPYSAMAWVNASGAATNIDWYSESNSAANNPFFQCQVNSGKARFAARQDSNGGTAELNFVSTVATVADGTWHHACFTQDGAGSPTHCRIYVDGVFDSAPTYTGGTTSLQRASIGALHRGTDSNQFAGKIAHVAVWERQLAPGEVSAIYFGAPIQNFSPTHYWPLVNDTVGGQVGNDFGFTQAFAGRNGVTGVAPVQPQQYGDNPQRAQQFRPRLWQARTLLGI